MLMQTRPPPERRWRYVISWLPLILVVAMLVYSYFAYVVRINISTLAHINFRLYAVETQDP